MEKYEVSCYGKDGAKIATISCNKIEQAIDIIGPDTVKLIVHDGETGHYVTEL